jgi:ribosomal protein L19E
MLLASRDRANDGTFNADPKYIQRVAYLNAKPNFKPLIDNGFLTVEQDASNVLAKCNTEERRGETEESRGEAEKRQRRATRLPTNWEPSLEEITFCKTTRPDLDLKITIDGFRDYWLAVAGSKGSKLDWTATWRNWVRNQRNLPRYGTETEKDRSRRETYEILTGKRNGQSTDANTIDAFAERLD